MDRAAEDFYQMGRFPRVIGAIDCTLIKMQSPGGQDLEIFRCRKGFFALNVQTVSDANLKIRNIVARWPGSSNDQSIFNNSALKRDFGNHVFWRYLLIGDSGYAILNDKTSGSSYRRQKSIQLIDNQDTKCCWKAVWCLETSISCFKFGNEALTRHNNECYCRNCSVS